MSKEKKHIPKKSKTKTPKAKHESVSPQVLALCDLIEQGGECPIAGEIYGTQSAFIGDHEIR